ncbi:MAG: hypothetical protein ACREOZ_02295, partial [Gloeomargaritales cyanobacterium]
MFVPVKLYSGPSSATRRELRFLHGIGTLQILGRLLGIISVALWRFPVFSPIDQRYISHDYVAPSDLAIATLREKNSNSLAATEEMAPPFEGLVVQDTQSTLSDGGGAFVNNDGDKELKKIPGSSSNKKFYGKNDNAWIPWTKRRVSSQQQQFETQTQKQEEPIPNYDDNDENDYVHYRILSYDEIVTRLHNLSTQ